MIQILLVNSSPVISRLTSLVASSAAAHVDEITGYEAIPKDQYDILLVDEYCCNEEEIRILLNKVTARKKILFSSQKERAIEGIDTVIVKPFLPSEISGVIETLPERSDEMPAVLAETESVQSAEIEAEKSNTAKKNSVLDSKEIEKIKQLLVDEGLEIAENEEGDMESGEVLIEEKKKKKPKKKKKKKVSRKTKKKEADFETNLLKAIIEMKPKKIKKLLEGSEIRISIRFPKEA